MNFDFHLIGCSFKQTRLENVSRVQWCEPDLIDKFLEKIQYEYGIEEVFYLQTCNRREFYIYSPNLENSQEPFFPKFLRVLGASLGVNLNLNDFYHLRNATAVRHFFCVASSLDSMVLGETEIIKQIKDQSRASSKCGHMGPRLKALVDLGLGVSKQVRHQTRITERVVSIASLAHRSVIQHLKGKKQRRLVFVGAGHFIRSMLPTFLKAQDLEIILVNRTHPADLVKTYGIRTLSLEAFLANPVPFEAMITATGAPNALFSAKWMRAHGQGALILDAALPRDVEVGDEPCPNTQYLDLDQLESVLAENRAAREAEIPRAEPFFREGIRRLQNRWLEFSLSGYSQEISEHYQHTGEKALQHLLKDVSPHLPPEGEQLLRDWTQALVGKLTSIPILGLKAVAQELGSDAVEVYARGVSSRSNLFKSHTQA